MKEQYINGLLRYAASTAAGAALRQLRNEGLINNNFVITSDFVQTKELVHNCDFDIPVEVIYHVEVTFAKTGEVVKCHLYVELASETGLVEVMLFVPDDHPEHDDDHPWWSVKLAGDPEMHWIPDHPLTDEQIERMTK